MAMDDNNPLLFVLCINLKGCMLCVYTCVYVLLIIIQYTRILYMSIGVLEYFEQTCFGDFLFA